MSKNMAKVEQVNKSYSNVKKLFGFKDTLKTRLPQWDDYISKILYHLSFHVIQKLLLWCFFNNGLLLNKTNEVQILDTAEGKAAQY